MSTPKKPRKYSARKEVKAIARERIGTVPATQVIVPKDRRKKPKYPVNPLDE